MELVKKICDKYFDDIINNSEQAEDSVKFIKQSEICDKLYDELHETLNDDQRKKLCNLSIEYSVLSGIWRIDGFEEGCEKGFKLAVRLMLESC